MKRNWIVVLAVAMSGWLGSGPIGHAQMEEPDEADVPVKQGKARVKKRPMPVKQAAAATDPQSPFHLVTIQLRALDSAGRPVPNARIHAYCEKRMLFVEDPLNPACETDKKGLGEFQAFRGEWTFFGVGSVAAKGQPARGWAVCKRGVTIADDVTVVTLQSATQVPLRCTNASAETIKSAQVWTAPRDWTPYWRPVKVCKLSGKGDFLETEQNPDDVFWLDAPGRRRSPVSYFLKATVTPNHRAVTWDADAKANASVTARPATPLPPGMTADLLVEHLEFLKGRHPIRCPVLAGGATMIVSPGDLAVRHNLAWGIKQKGLWRAEFCNDNVTLKANQQHNVVISTKLRGGPCIDRADQTRLMFWFDALDEAGRRLGQLSAPKNAAFAKLELFDENGKETHELTINGCFQKRQGLVQNGPNYVSTAFSNIGTYVFTCDLGPLGNFDSKGDIPAGRTSFARQVRREHLTLRYPRATMAESQRQLDQQASIFADGLERMVVETYRWYGLPVREGLNFRVELFPPTTGGAGGRMVILNLGYLLNWDARRPLKYAVASHELGHISGYGLKLREMLPKDGERDELGFYGQAHASFKGYGAILSMFGKQASGVMVAAHASRMLRILKGKEQGDSDFFYLCCYLQNELGDEFTRRCVHLASAEPPTVCERIRAQDWTPVEKVCAFHSVAAGKDLGPYFRGLKFDVRKEVGPAALRLCEGLVDTKAKP